MQRKTSAQVDILIVDDQIGVRSLLCVVLNEAGYTVATASNGYEGVQKTYLHSPSLVIMDLKMPIMDGIQALEEIRKSFSSLPVIIMTAYGDEETVNQIGKIPCTVFVAKPFDVNSLLEKVHSQLTKNVDLVANL